MTNHLVIANTARRAAIHSLSKGSLSSAKIKYSVYLQPAASKRKFLKSAPFFLFFINKSDFRTIFVSSVLGKQNRFWRLNCIIQRGHTGGRTGSVAKACLYFYIAAFIKHRCKAYGVVIAQRFRKGGSEITVYSSRCYAAYIAQPRYCDCLLYTSPSPRDTT